MNDTELDVADDIEASGYFNLAVLNNGVKAQVCESSDLSSALSSPKSNLLSISNVFGCLVAGNATGFSLYHVASLRNEYQAAKQRTTIAPEPHIKVEVGQGGLTFLKFGFADKVIIAAGPALQGGVGVWRLKSLVDRTSTTPLHVFPSASGTPLLDVLPNPGDRPELLALLHQDGQLSMVNMDAKTASPRFGSGLTSACWSVRGKQIVCGDGEGNLTQYTPEGAAKTVTQAPTSLRGRSMAAVDIRWIENAVFVVTYLDPSNPFDTSIFISTRAKDGSVTYNAILDPLMVENPDRQEGRFNTWLKSWEPFKHLVLVANTTSNTVSHIGQGPSEENGENIVWSQVKNDLYTTLPLDTSTLGIEIDLTDTQVEEAVGNVATPLLWAFASDGSLSAWRICNSKGGQYSAIAVANDVLVNEEAGAVAAAASTAASAPAPAAPAASPFGNPNSAATAFGQSSFGASKSFSTPAFGGGSAFGNSTFAPAFGQSTFGSSSPSPAFGQSSAFGQPAASTSAAPSGAFSSFSNKGSTFGTAASSSSSPFASAAPSPPATSGFGSSSTPAFGASTAFGQTAKPGAASGAASPFTMSTSNSPAEEKKPAFGSASPFGSASGTSSPFGSTTASKPSGFSAFGDTSKSSGFGSFAAKTDGKSAFSFGSSGESSSNAFGQKPASAFGGLRDSANTSASETQGAKKPTGLDDTEADDLEPEKVSTQTGGALDFGDEKSDKSEENAPLKLDSLGFGGSAASASKPASSPFGAFGKVLGDVKKQDASDKGDNKPASTSPFGTSSGFGAFGQSSTSASPFGAKAADAKPTFSFANVGKAAEPAAKAEEQKPAFSFAPKPTEEEKKPASITSAQSDGGVKAKGSASKPAFGFGAPAFAQTSKPDEKSAASKPASGFAGFGQASPLGQSTGKTAFSFGKPAETPKAGGGFASFASASSSSASPFGSPSASSGKTSPFRQPGFFSSFGQKKEDSQPKKEEDKTDNDSEKSEAKGSAKSAFPKAEAQQPIASTSAERIKGGEETEEEDEDEEEEYPDEYNEEEEANEQEEGDEEDDFEQVEAEGSAEEEEEEGDDGESEGDEQTPTRPAKDDSAVAEEPDLSSQTSSEPPSPTPAKTQPAAASGSKAPAFSFAKKADEASQSKDAEAKSPFSSRSSSPASTPAETSKPFSFAPKAPTPADKPKEPETAKASAPDTTTTPPSSFPFANFGKAAEPAKDAKGAADKPAAPSFGFPAATTSKSAEPPKPFGFSNLQKAAPRTSSPLASMPSFAPNDSSTASQTSFELSNASSIAEAEPSSSNPSPFSLTPQAKPASTPSFFQSATTPKAEPSKEPASPAPSRPALVSRKSDSSLTALNTVPPKLTSAPSQDKVKQLPNDGTVRVFVTMQEQLAALKASTSDCLNFFHHVQPPRVQAQASPSELLQTEAGEWSLGDLPRLQELAKALNETLTTITHRASDEERAAKSLEGSLLKTKAKAEEIARHLKAKDDPQVARIVKIRQLGPEQLENQTRIRRSNQNVTEALEELERAITLLKDKALDKKLGRTPMKAPSLDSIHRAMRNITAALQRRILELDDLSLRLDMLTLSTASPRRDSRAITPRREATPDLSSSREGTPVPESNGSPRRRIKDPTEMEKKVQKSLEKEAFGQRLKAAWLDNGRRKEPLLNTSANVALR